MCVPSQCYEPPAGFRPIHEAFAECPAPKLGVSQYCLGHIAPNVLSDVEDRFEDSTGSEGLEMQQLMTSSGLVINAANSVAQIVEGRYFGFSGGGRGFSKRGWAGTADNFANGTADACVRALCFCVTGCVCVQACAKTTGLTWSPAVTSCVTL